jgi:ribosomal protein L7/L12
MLCYGYTNERKKMSKVLEVLELLASRGNVAYLADGLELAKAIDTIYTPPATPGEWAKANVNEFYSQRKIQFIKDIRAAIPGTSLVDSKKAAEDAISDYTLGLLREKLLNPITEPAWSIAEDEDRAYAEHRERIAEQGTWFGAPGPLDEEPF